LGILDIDKVLYLEHLDARRSVRVSAMVGGRYLLHTSAPGKVLLAHADQGLLERLTARGLERCTRRTLCTANRLSKNLRDVLRLGYAMDLEESMDGLMCFAVPIRNFEGEVVASVGTSVLTLHYSVKELVSKLGPKVLAAGRKISLALGYDEQRGRRTGDET
jgi:DNA-binding IclR family transcriptional regulator